MSRIRVNDGLRTRIYGAIHEVVMTKRIEILRGSSLGLNASEIELLLHDLVEPIFEDVMEAMTKNLP